MLVAACSFGVAFEFSYFRLCYAIKTAMNDTSHNFSPRSVRSTDASYCYRRCEWSDCVSMCWTRPWALQKRLSRSRFRLGEARMGQKERYIIIGHDPPAARPNGNGHFKGRCAWHPLGNGHTPSLRPPGVTSSTQQGRQVAAMRAVVTSSLAARLLVVTFKRSCIKLLLKPNVLC